MTQANYFLIDGSALTAQIRQLQRAHPQFRNRTLCPRRLVAHFMRTLNELHGGSYKRVTFYFPTGDETAIEEYLAVPDHKRPGEIRDIHFKFCGHKLKKSAEFDKFVEENVPAKFQDRFAKSEKGIDIEMCCDAIKLASASQVDRLFLLTNDGDFIPFCKTVKEFGANISILHLSEATQPNQELIRHADSYDVVPINSLQNIFLAPATILELPLTAPDSLQANSTEVAVDVVISEKSDAAPSDLPTLSVGEPTGEPASENAPKAADLTNQ